MKSGYLVRILWNDRYLIQDSEGNTTIEEVPDTQYDRFRVCNC